MATNTNLNVNVNVNDEQVPQSEEKFKSLRRQIRETTVQLQELTDKGETQGKKFSELNLKLAELRTEAEQVNNKTQSLTSTFQLMGGAVGEFGDKAEVGIQALKTISSFTLKDIQNQFAVVGQELKTFGLKILEAAGFTKAYAATNTFLAESFVAVGVSEEAAALGAKAFSAAIVATGIGAIIIGLVALYQNWDKITQAIDGTTEAEIAFGEASKKAAEKNGEQIATLDQLSRLIKSGTVDQYQKNEAVNNYNKVLGDTLGKVKDWGELEDKLKDKLPAYKKYLSDKAMADSAYLLSIEVMKEKIKISAMPPTEAAGAWDKFFAGLGSFLENSSYKENVKVAGQVNQILDTKKLEEKLNTYNEIYDSFKKKADDEAKNLKIVAPTITYTGDTKNNKVDPRIAQAKAVQVELDKLVEADYMSTLSARDKELYAAGEKYNDLLVKAKKYHIDTTALTEGFRMQEASINKKYDDDERKKEQERNDKSIKDNIAFEVKLAEDLQKLDEKKKNDKIKALDDDVKLLQAQEASLIKGTKAYFDVAQQIEDKSYQERKLKAEGNAKDLEEIEKTHKNNNINIKVQQMEAEKQIQLETVDMYASIGQLLGQIAGKSKELAIAGLLIEKAAAVAKVVISTNAAIAEYALLSLSLGPIAGPIAATAYATTQHINEAISIASIIAAAAIGVSGISSGGGETSATTSAAPASPTAGKQGYGDGGLINGRRHAEGGIMVNAEGGEAIMTRGAVTMFGPLLSQLNQMGGGTAFNKAVSGMAKNDNPKSPSNPSSEQQIIKTYVVAQDMNTMNHKQARLKDLSTL